VSEIRITTPAGIEHFQMARCIAALKIEVQTGLVHSRGSILALVRRDYGVKSRSKKGALEEMLTLYKNTYGWEYGSEIVD
jgi:hypothetical protein